MKKQKVTGWKVESCKMVYGPSSNWKDSNSSVEITKMAQWPGISFLGIVVGYATCHMCHGLITMLSRSINFIRKKTSLNLLF